MLNFQFETEMLLLESGWVCSGICRASVNYKKEENKVLEKIKVAEKIPDPEVI